MSSYLTFWPCFTFSSSVILLCFFRPGLAQFLGYTLGSLLDSHANFLPALLHLATLEKSLSKLGLDHGSSDLGTIFMGMIFWFTSVQFSHVWPFVTPWMAASQAPLSIANSRSLLKLMSFELVMPSNHRILCHPLLLLPSIFPSIRVFSNESVLCIRIYNIQYQSIGVSGSASVLPMNIQGWFPLGWTGWISLQSKGLSNVFSNTTVQKHQFFGADFW